MLSIKKGMLVLSALISIRLIQAGPNNQRILVHENNDFRVENEEGSFSIQRCYMDKELRGISADRLAKFAAAGGYLQVSELKGNNHEYTLKLKGRLNGGGPVLGNILYWGVKALGYGVPATVATASVAAVAAPLVAAGGAAGAVAGGASATAGLVIQGAATAGAASVAATSGAVVATGATTVTSALVAGAGGAAAAGTIIGEATIGAVGLNTAATATAGIMGAGGSVGTYVTCVELVATGAFGAGMAVWWLP
jgi:hypothetical protein